MKKYILQHCTNHQQDLLSISMPYNKTHADKYGFTYISSDFKLRSPNKPLNYEKIGYLNEMLPQLEENSLVVWLDTDTICLPHNRESFEKALPEGGIIGMVRMLYGINGRQPSNWWNIGVTCLRNIKVVRDFFSTIHERDEENDEFAFMRQLKEQCWIIGDNKGLSSLDYKWNCWPNNSHVCPDPNVISFHGIKSENKLVAMNKFLDTIKK